MAGTGRGKRDGMVEQCRGWLYLSSESSGTANIRYLSKLLGPVRYDFFVGSLKGHMGPRSPWAHMEMFSFRPTVATLSSPSRGRSSGVARGMHRSRWGRFGIASTTPTIRPGVKRSRAMTRERDSATLVPRTACRVCRKYVTFYLDSICHDDVTPISAPRRASYRTGLYVSQIPKLNKFDFRVEAASTDPGVGPAHARSICVLGGDPTAGIHQQGLHYGRLDWPRGQGGPGMADVSFFAK